MKLHEYISLNFLSLVSYISFILIIYFFFLENLIEKNITKAYITLEIYGQIYLILIFLAFVLIFLFGIEILIQKKFPKLLPKIKIKDVRFKKLHNFLFIIGFWFAIFNLIVFLIILTNH